MGGMKPGMMMVLNKASQYERMPRNEYGGDPERRMIGFDRDYSSETRRRRDSRGRYMESDYTPHMGGYGYGMEPESRRRRDSRGRYMMGGMGMDDDDDYGYRMMDEPPHMTGSRYGVRDVYADIHTGGVANRPMGSMMAMMGGDMSEPVDEHTARKWVQKMDGGEHFKAEQADQLRASMCPDCKKWDFYVALNAMYSDHCETAKKVNMDKPEFYAMLAKDFLKDTDAKPHKLRNYMTFVAK